MILREATPDDIPPLFALCKKAWAHLGIPFHDDAARFADWTARARAIVLYDDTGMAAAEAATPIETDRGPGFQIGLLVVAPDRPDPMQLLDAIVFYGCTLALADHRPIVVSHDPKRTPTIYGRDMLGMEAEDVGPRVEQIGDMRIIAHVILERRPQWRPSL